MGTQLGLLCVTDRQAKGALLNASSGAVIAFLPASTADVEYENQSNFRRSVSMSMIGEVPSTGEYKLLRIHWHERNPRVEQTCEVITLGGRGRAGDDTRWRVRPCPPVLVSMATMQRVVSGGIVYFLLAPHRDDNNVNVKKDEIASFDLATDEWSHGTLRGPVGGHLGRDVNHGDVIVIREFYLANLDGCLVVVCRYITRTNRGYYYDRCSIDFWYLMNADKGLWTKRYSVQCAPFGQGTFFPLDIVEDERILIWVTGTEELRAYDTRTGAYTNLSAVENLFELRIFNGSLLC
ncbi:unnamed protein product [Urochloa humidicola]